MTSLPSTQPPVYGVFLRPDARTSTAVSTITFLVERQFGLVSAGAYPPHATLAGSVPMLADEADIIAALDPVLTDRPGFPVHNGGIATRSAIGYDVDRLADGSVNEPLHSLAVDVNAALEPLVVPLDGYLVKEFRADHFRAHLSLASHELMVWPERQAEVDAFIRQLDIAPSTDFTAEYVSMYRFQSDDWSGHWWNSLEWEPVHTWNLTSEAAGASIADAPELIRGGCPHGCDGCGRTEGCR
jgi:hypothetical protein